MIKASGRGSRAGSILFGSNIIVEESVFNKRPGWELKTPRRICPDITSKEKRSSA
jgi:hypothetical protein